MFDQEWTTYCQKIWENRMTQTSTTHLYKMPRPNVYGSSVLDFAPDDRVELRPDSWAKNDRFGTVLKPSQHHLVTEVKVKLDFSNEIVYFSPDCLLKII